MIYGISYKPLNDAKLLPIRFDKKDGFIRVYDGTRYLVLFGFENYLQLYKSKKQYNIYVFSLLYEKSKLILSILYLWKKYLTLHNLIILIKRLLNKDQNHYCYNIFLEKCTYQLAKK